MYSLRLFCGRDEAELVAAELWDWGTVAISETEWDQQITLLAGFETNQQQEAILLRFAIYAPEWDEDETDWTAETKRAWPPREIGERLFLAPPWSEEETPSGRVRLIHNPGLASGTGEHPCTQLALAAIERLVKADHTILDVGAGSGILAIAGKLLGARTGIATDTDLPSLETARENFVLNALRPMLVGGSADCIHSHTADLTVANISGTVLLSILDELLRVTKTDGTLILTGFTEGEAITFQKMFPHAQVLAFQEWRCLLISSS